MLAKEMETATREAEKIRRDAQSQLETVRIDTEMEMLTLHTEVLDETRDSESVKAKPECTSEYVQSQTEIRIVPLPLTHPTQDYTTAL